jgi:hypothetical protein
MSNYDDESDEMTRGHGVRSGAGGPTAAGDDGVTRFLTELRALGDGPAPTPTPELAALLGRRPALPRRAVIRIAVRTALVAAAVITALVVAAANHSLPSPAQRVVSHVVNVLTPFHINRDVPPAVEPPRPSDKPQPPARTTPHRSAPAAPPGEDSSEGRGEETGRPGTADGAGGAGAAGDAGDDGGERDEQPSRRSGASPRSDDGSEGSGDQRRGGDDDSETRHHRTGTATPTPGPSSPEDDHSGSEGPVDH